MEWLAKDNPSLVSVVLQKVNELTEEQLELPVFPAKRQTKYKSLERQVQKRLAQTLNGKTEVQCKTGVIDILTKSEIIEVKKAKEWKHAIGQVLIYQLEYPNRQARIHLYGECSDEFKQMIIAFSSQLNVIATFEN